MELRLILKFVGPILLISYGIWLKVSNNNSSAKNGKNWILFLIGGVTLLIFRTYKHLI